MSRAVIIDIGTQSILYLLAEYFPDKRIIPLHQEVRSVRLGEQIDSTGNISQAALKRTVHTLNELKDMADHQSPQFIIAVGTQVFRGAANQKLVVDSVAQQTGIDVEILSERDEAEWSFKGAVGGRSIDGPVAVADIGGGSTEIVLGEGQNLITDFSLPIGSVVLTERCFRHDPPSYKEVQAIEEEILHSFSSDVSGCLLRANTFIGVGGTATTLAALQLGLDSYDAKQVDGLLLKRKEILQFIDGMKRQTNAQRKAWLTLDPARADIILSGAIILNKIMQLGEFKEVVVSDRGLRFGILIREIEKNPANHS